MWLSGKTEARESYMLETRLPVTGLNVQAPVRFRGVEVGKVETIEFLPNDARVILVRIAVRADTPITKGTYAQLGSQGVTGLAYVILDDEGKQSRARGRRRPRTTTFPSGRRSSTRSRVRARSSSRT